MQKDKKKYLIILLLTLIHIGLFGQQAALQKFRLDGTINIDTGTIELIFDADSLYYPASAHQLSAKVFDHKFSFEGSISYPIGIKLFQSNGRYISGMFIIEPGNQNIICNSDSNKSVPQVQNKVMREYYDEYVPVFAQLNKERTLLKMYQDSLYKLYNKNVPDSLKVVIERRYKNSYTAHDKVLLNYTLNHPSSYIAFWKFVELSVFGYEDTFDKIYDGFSPAIKNTYTGRYVGNKLRNSSMMAIGKKFPDIESDKVNLKKFAPVLFSKNKYTLVDFWYSHCMPCIGQFPELKDIYNQFHTYGFEIAAISTDAVKYRDNWLSVIKANSLPWLQYWDRNGKEASRLSIAAFPSNFLIDDKGIIIAQNLRPAEIKQFLKENLRN